MVKFKLFIVNFINFAFLLSCVNSTCVIHSPEGSPLFIKDFGLKKIVLPKISQSLELDTYETIQAYCITGFTLSADYHTFIRSADGVNAIEVNCNGHSMTYRNSEYDDEPPKDVENTDIKLNCHQGTRTVYESEYDLPNCSNYASYGVGLAVSPETQIVTAGICYNLRTLTLKYVTYIAYRPKYTVLENKFNSTPTLAISLDRRLSGFNSLFQFLSQGTFNKSYQAKQNENLLLQQQEFELVSLVQDAALADDLQDYNNMLNVIWWRNLRLGNWHYFLKALEARTENTTYTVYTGTSGILAIPSARSDRPEDFVINASEQTVKAPAYIWSYLKSPQEEFVVIASNSPFVQNISFFCNDICHQIDWLAQSIFDKTYSLPTFGTIICCKVDEVAAKLENFPLPPPKQENPSTLQTLLSPAKAVTKIDK